MSPAVFTINLFLLLGAFWSFLQIRAISRRKSLGRSPPGPPALPIIGNLHKLGRLPHRSLHALARKYGPIMSIKLGSVPVVVVSSPPAAELFLRTHDNVFASRPKTQAAEYLYYGTKGMGFTEYGPYWRSVRKLCTSELLSVAKVESYAGMRREEVGAMLRSLKAAAAAGEAVDVDRKVEELVEDMTCRMVFGRKCDERFDLKGVIREDIALAGAFNVADFVPLLAPLDLQGLTRRVKKASKVNDEILERIMDEHKQDAIANQRQHRALIDVLLSLAKKSSTNPDECSLSIDRTNAKAIVLDIILGSFDTSSTAISWIMSELLRHPRVMKKLQKELDRVVGQDRVVEETDLTNLKYLEMVIKESLRLHPVAPLLVPRESMEDIDIMLGEDCYFIPKKSRIIVNSWALGRDPEAWLENIEEFLPERFIDREVNLRGHHFELLPFGSGRRICPGMRSGLMTIQLVVAQLVHCFDWALPDGILPEKLDMSEKFGLSLPRAEHLVAIPSYRLSN
ncbi:cytochrome P450 CYP736A12-like [Diospyros lotus]|uniref:cytochrome P450 CYP736A12-like n=1 Tax=Diospyros lotus TaxID=55363 RepID=UPI002258B019|nr:cytochrome P450 CYP736A12-like [Diospyros lotus]